MDHWPIFFCEMNGLCRKFCKISVKNHPQIWFRQDGAKVHTARATMAFLPDIFGERISYLKGKIYVNKPRNIEE